ncbi:MAG: transglutaminase family protein [Georgenia sp.]
MSSKRGDQARHYRVRHLWTYTYPEVVRSSYGRAMLLPRDGHGQRVHEATLTVTPEPEETGEHQDLHGNTVSYFHVTQEHSCLTVMATSLVSVTRRRPDPTGTPSVPWELVVASVSSMRATGQGGQGEGPSSVLAITESALASELAAPDDAVREYAMGSFRPGKALVGAALDLARRIAADHTYDGDAAPTGRPAVTLARRTGCSADLAHLMVACLRSMGLAARYVSGYVVGEADDDAPGGDEARGGTPGNGDAGDDAAREGATAASAASATASHRGVGTTHAWAGVWVPGGGWIHLDPANARFVDGRYIALAWGRDLGDAPPLQGIVYTPGAGSSLVTELRIEPVSNSELRRLRATAESGVSEPAAPAPGGAG